MINSEVELKKFFEGVKKIKSSVVEENGKPKMGFEVEYTLLDESLKPVVREVVPRVIAENPTSRGLELGGAQIEIRTLPEKTTSIQVLRDALKLEEEKLIDSCRKYGIRILRMGAVPTIHPNELVIADAERYKIVPRFHDERRTPGNIIIGGINFDQANCVGMFNSVQINLQAKSVQDGIDKVNRSFMIAPYLAALCGNARIINGQDTGIDDIRMIAWEKTHDLRTQEHSEHRVGLPESYYTNIDDCFMRISKHPFIFDTKEFSPEKIVMLGIGLNWKDTRLKFIGNNGSGYAPVVEFRIISTQPTAEEDLASMMCYMGRLEWSQMMQENLLAIELVNTNRRQALQYGMDGLVYVSKEGKVRKENMRHLVGYEIEKAKEGLLHLGFEKREIDSCLEVLINRTETPASTFAKDVRENGLENATKRYLL